MSASTRAAVDTGDFDDSQDSFTGAGFAQSLGVRCLFKGDCNSRIGARLFGGTPSDGIDLRLSKVFHAQFDA